MVVNTVAFKLHTLYYPHQLVKIIGKDQMQSRDWYALFERNQYDFHEQIYVAAISKDEKAISDILASGINIDVKLIDWSAKGYDLECTPAERLAKNGFIDAAEFLRKKYGANIGSIIFGAIYGGQQDYADSLFKEYPAEISHYASGLAAIGQSDKVQALRATHGHAIDIDSLILNAAFTRSEPDFVDLLLAQGANKSMYHAGLIIGDHKETLAAIIRGGIEEETLFEMMVIAGSYNNASIVMDNIEDNFINATSFICSAYGTKGYMVLVDQWLLDVHKKCRLIADQLVDNSNNPVSDELKAEFFDGIIADTINNLASNSAGAMMVDPDNSCLYLFKNDKLALHTLTTIHNRQFRKELAANLGQKGLIDCDLVALASKAGQLYQIIKDHNVAYSTALVLQQFMDTFEETIDNTINYYTISKEKKISLEQAYAISKHKDSLVELQSICAVGELPPELCSKITGHFTGIKESQAPEVYNHLVETITERPRWYNNTRIPSLFSFSSPAQASAQAPEKEKDLVEIKPLTNRLSKSC